MQTKYIQPSKYKPFLYMLLVAVLVISIIIGLEATNTTHFFHKSPPMSGFKSTPTTGGGSADNQKGEHNLSSSQSSTPPNSGPASSNPQVSLITPFGNFVSNHTPGQNGTPENETSVCNTSSGAKCQIIFTSGSDTKTLPAQMTDLAGETFWNNWAPSDIGLTKGSWRITAIASLNGQTKTASDSRELQIQ